MDVVTTRHKALAEAIYQYGTMADLARQIKVSRKRIEKWRNQDVRIPYEYTVMIAMKTHISLRRLAPDKSCKEINDFINTALVHAMLQPMPIKIDNLSLPDYSISHFSLPYSPPIVGTDGVLRPVLN